MDHDQQNQCLLDCLRARSAEEPPAHLGRLSESDWNQVFDLSKEHGVTPQLYDRISTQFSTCAIPPGVMLKLRAAYLANAAQNVRLYHELGQILGTLRKEKIAVVVLKGAHLAEVVYGNIALRTMIDLDLLVHKSDLARTAASLLELGYSFHGCHDIDACCRKHHHLPAFVRPGATCIEVHWAISPPTSPFTIDVAGLWERARPSVIAGTETLVLSTEDLLLHLCIHASHNHEGFVLGLRPICDVSATILRHRHEIDWERLRIRAREWGVGNCVCLTLRLARELLHVPVPEDLLGSLDPKDAGGDWSAFAKEQILAPAEMRLMSLSLAQMFGSKPLLAKVQILLRAVFLPPKRMEILYHLPSRSIRVYWFYVWRPIQLFLRYGCRAWQLARGDREAARVAKYTKKHADFADWLDLK
jgi:hypothetical protein